MSVTDPLLKTLKLQILELHRCFQFIQTYSSPSAAASGDGDSASAAAAAAKNVSAGPGVEGCCATDAASRSTSGNGGVAENSADVDAHLDPIDDSHPYLFPLCRTLEEIFRKGLLPTTAGSLLSLSVKKDDYWRWIETLSRENRKLPQNLRAAIDSVKRDERVLTYVGRGSCIIF